MHQFKTIGQKLVNALSSLKTSVSPFTLDFLVMDPRDVKSKYGDDSTLAEIGIMTNTLQQLVTSVDDERLRLLSHIKVDNTEHKSKAKAKAGPAKKRKV